MVARSAIMGTCADRGRVRVIVRLGGAKLVAGWVLAWIVARTGLAVYIYFVRTSPDADARGGTTPSGDRLSTERFAALFTEHHRTLWYVAAAVMNDRTHAHDVLQEAAMVAMKKLDEFDPATSFAAWMSQVVRFVAMNQSRKEKRHRGAGNSDDHDLENSGAKGAGIGGTQMSVGEGPVLALVGANEDDELVAAVAGLDEKSRTCLLLRTVRGLPYAAIATTMQMPEGTVMSMVHRAKAQIRTTLTLRAELKPDRARLTKGGGT